jgi:hypothetical protein
MLHLVYDSQNTAGLGLGDKEFTMIDRDKYDKAVQLLFWECASNAYQLFGEEIGPLLLKLNEADPETDLCGQLAKTCRAWSEFEELYAYAESGVTGDFGPAPKSELYDGVVDGTLRLPREVEEVFLMAEARLVLDGSAREWNRDLAPEAHLSLHEVALLANMEDASVRNAITAKQLAAKTIKNRVFIGVADAQKWLSKRRGFIPTGAVVTPKQEYVPLEPTTYADLQQFAATRSLSVDQAIAHLLEGALK